MIQDTNRVFLIIYATLSELLYPFPTPDHHTHTNFLSHSSYSLPYSIHSSFLAAFVSAPLHCLFLLPEIIIWKYTWLASRTSSGLSSDITFSKRPIPATFLKIPILPSLLGFPGGLVIKNSPANAGDTVSIPGSGRLLEEEMETHSGILAWRFPWTEKPDWLQSMGLQSQTELSTQTHSIPSYMRTTSSLLPGGSDGKESVCNAGDLGSIPG